MRPVVDPIWEVVVPRYDLENTKGAWAGVFGSVGNYLEMDGLCLASLASLALAGIGWLALAAWSNDRMWLWTKFMHVKYVTIMD